MGYEFEDDGTETLGIKTTDDFDVSVTWLDGNSATNGQGIVWRCITATIKDETEEIYIVDLKIEDRYHHTLIAGDASRIPEKGEWDSFSDQITVDKEDLEERANYTETTTQEWALQKYVRDWHEEHPVDLDGVPQQG